MLLVAGALTLHSVLVNLFVKKPVEKMSETAAATATAAEIKVGMTIPDVQIKQVTPAAYEPVESDKAGAACSPTGIANVNTGALFKDKKLAVLFAVPGAFTPGCSQSHLPPYVEKYDELKALGVDLIACMSWNDGFCMKAWGIDQKVGTKVLLLADGCGAFTTAMGLVLDATAFGMGLRSKRFAMILKEGVVKHIFIDTSGVKETHVDNIIKTLKADHQ